MYTLGALKWESRFDNGLDPDGDSGLLRLLGRAKMQFCRAFTHFRRRHFMTQTNPRRARPTLLLLTAALVLGSCSPAVMVNRREDELDRIGSVGVRSSR